MIAEKESYSSWERKKERVVYDSWKRFDVIYDSQERKKRRKKYMITEKMEPW